MSVADLLGDVGQGLATGAKAVGKAAIPIAQRTAEVLSGEAPQIDATDRQRAEKLEDEQINAKAGQLESQLQMAQKYGTLTPQQQQDYANQITGLYNKPRHSQVLMDKLRQAVHPNGATAQGPQAPLVNATPPGGTAAADAQTRLTSLTGTDDEKKEQALKSIDWFKKNMLPQFPPDQQAAKLNAYVDHINGITQGIEKPPKGMKAMEQGGVFFGVTDQDTGKQYLTAQLGPGGDAPPEAKQMYAAVQKAAADKQKAADLKSKESEDRQLRSFSHSLQMQTIGLQKALELGDYKEAKREVTKSDEAYQGAIDRANTMDKSLTEGLQGNQQAMVNLLANHVAMTKQQVGTSMRPTRADYVEAMESLPEFDKLVKQFDSNHGLLSGITLSPDQMRQMVDLAHEKVSTLQEHVDRVKSEYKDALEPAPLTGAKKVGSLLPKTGAKPVQSAAPAKPIVQHSASTGQYRYSTDGGKTWQPGQPPKQ